MAEAYHTAAVRGHRQGAVPGGTLRYWLPGHRRGAVPGGTLRYWLPGGSVQYTPKGLAWRSQLASLRYSSNIALAALIAAQDGINPEQYRQWAMCQVHYALGDTVFSYQVGFGAQGWPLQPHHRGASTGPVDGRRSHRADRQRRLPLTPA
ncbi:hypothetical protein ACOMHN_033880 [Nucella lapillus]